MGRRRERYLTTQEAAELLAVSSRTNRIWMQEGFLRAVRLRRRWRVPERSLDDFLEEARRAG